MKINVEVEINSESIKSFKSLIPQLKDKPNSGDHLGQLSFFGITGSTFRAYQNKKRPPSEVYREWARTTLNGVVETTDAEKYKNKDEFENWSLGLLRSLDSYWSEQQEEELKPAHLYKMRDLFLRFLCMHKSCPETLARSILQYGNSPLDSQSLAKLNECLKFSLPMENPSMKSVTNENSYNFCQQIIEAIAKKAGGSKLMFDFWAYKKGGDK